MWEIIVTVLVVWGTAFTIGYLAGKDRALKLEGKEERRAER